MLSTTTIHALRSTILEARGINVSELSPAETRIFWEPNITDLHDPFLLVGMQLAVERVLQARETKERVVIFGDYDVDGVSSTAMLMRFFTQIGIAVSYRIPHRSHDGYGMKPYFFDELATKWVWLVISVDCGTRDIVAIQHAKSLGIDVIVTDHHAVPSVIPEEAVAIISVKLPNSPYPYKWLSGSGTAFKLLHAVASKIYSVEGLPDILMSYIDFAMLWTVADMMPLTGENRIIVKLGLTQATSSRSPGLRRMMAGKNTANADCVGFYVGPRINAAGRMDHAETALKALICSDTQVGSLLDELENLNTERKGSTAHFVEEALENIDPTKNGVIYRSDSIDHGVIGLVAGRLAERLGKPAIACLQWVRVPQKPKPEEITSQNNESDTLMQGLSDEVPLDTVFVFGSMRSPPSYDITAGLDRIAALRPDIFVAYGGHAQAAGFTIYPEQFETFCALWQADIASFKKVEDALVSGGSTESLIGKPWVFDARLALDDCTLDFVRAVEQIGPFGIGFVKPLFALVLEKLPVIEALGSSGEHIKLVGPKGVKINGFWLGKYEQGLSNMRNTAVELLVEVDRETWQGRESVVISVRDIRKAEVLNEV